MYKEFAPRPPVPSDEAQISDALEIQHFWQTLQKVLPNVKRVVLAKRLASVLVRGFQKVSQKSSVLVRTELQFLLLL